ncbi:hypothetical protein CapIbe_005421 [Capra ibex]
MSNVADHLPPDFLSPVRKRISEVEPTCVIWLQVKGKESDTTEQHTHTEKEKSRLKLRRKCSVCGTHHQDAFSGIQEVLKEDKIYIRAQPSCSSISKMKEHVNGNEKLQFNDKGKIFHKSERTV